MSIICKKCGRQLADNAKFCGGCGARIGEQTAAVTPGKCPVCGANIAPGVHFCTVCGTSIAASPSEKTEEEIVTMDELVPPVITDDLFEEPKINAAAHNPETEVEAVTEVYKDPIFANNNNVPNVPDTAAAPIPEVKLPETPVINDTYYQQPAPAPAPKPVQQPVYQQPAPTPVQQPNPMQNNYNRPPQQPQYQPQGYQQPVPPVPNGYQNPQQPQYQPYPDPRTVQTKQGGGSSIIVPIILIILILGVIAFDVFYLFRDRIFGSDDDDSKKSKDTSSVVSTVDDDDEESEEDDD